MTYSGATVWTPQRVFVSSNFRITRVPTDQISTWISYEAGCRIRVSSPKHLSYSLVSNTKHAHLCSSKAVNRLYIVVLAFTHLLGSGNIWYCPDFLSAKLTVECRVCWTMRSCNTQQHDLGLFNACSHTGCQSGNLLFIARQGNQLRLIYSDLYPLYTSGHRESEANIRSGGKHLHSLAFPLTCHLILPLRGR